VNTATLEFKKKKILFCDHKLKMQKLSYFFVKGNI